MAERETIDTKIPTNTKNIDCKLIDSANQTDASKHCLGNRSENSGSCTSVNDSIQNKYVTTNVLDQFCDLHITEILNDEDSLIQCTTTPLSIMRSNVAPKANLQSHTEPRCTLPQTNDRFCREEKVNETVTESSCSQHNLGSKKVSVESLASDGYATYKSGSETSTKNTCRGKIEPLTDDFLSGTNVDDGGSSTESLSHRIAESDEITHAAKCSFENYLFPAKSDPNVEPFQFYIQSNGVLAPNVTDKEILTPRPLLSKGDRFDWQNGMKVTSNIKELSETCRTTGSNMQIFNQGLDDEIRLFPHPALKNGSPDVSNKLLSSLKDTCCTGIQSESHRKQIKKVLSNSPNKASRSITIGKTKGKGLSKTKKKYKTRPTKRCRVKKMKKRHKTLIKLKWKGDFCSVGSDRELQEHTKAEEFILKPGGLFLFEELNGIKDLRNLKYQYEIKELKGDYSGYIQGVDEIKALIDLVFQKLSNTIIPTSSYTSIIAYPVSETDDGAGLWNRLHSFIRYTGNGSSVNLARSGFLCEQEGNATRCHACNLICSDWGLLDNVAERHRRLSPNCPLLPPADGGNNNAVPSLPVNHNMPISRNQPEVVSRNMTVDASFLDNAQSQGNQSAEQNSEVDVQPSGASERQAVPIISENSHQEYQENQEEITIYLGELHGTRRRGQQPEFLDTGQIVPENNDTTRQNNHEQTARDAAQRSLAGRRAENRELQDMLFCEKCKRNEANMLFQPCRHLCFCETCAENIHKCPVCKLEVDTKTKVFRS